MNQASGKCDLCDKFYYTPHSVRIHMSKAHQNAPVPAWAAPFIKPGNVCKHRSGVRTDVGKAWLGECVSCGKRVKLMGVAVDKN